MTEKRECGRCKFWQAGQSLEPNAGICRHGPPTFDSDQCGHGGFPVMYPDQWCYQFELKWFEEREHGGEDGEEDR